MKPGAQPGNRNAAHAQTPDEILHVRCTEADKQSWKASAKEKGLSLSRWVIERLNK